MKSCGTAVLSFVLVGSTAFSEDVLEYGAYKGYRVKVNRALQRDLLPHKYEEFVAKSGYDWVIIELEFEADDSPPATSGQLERHEDKYRGLLDFKDVRLIERGQYEAVHPDDVRFEGKYGASTSMSVEFDKKRKKGKVELWFIVPDEFQVRAATFKLDGQYLYPKVEALEILRRLDDHAWE